MLTPPGALPLPVDGYLGEVVRRVADDGGLVLTAEPGAGKTTRVPPALLASGRFPGRIVVLEPRRVAARAAAARIATEWRWRLGEEVGYRVRFERRESVRTRLLVVTEGLLVRMLQVDPFLEGISCIVFDELHERSLDADLALAMALRVREQARPDLAIVAMSATIDAAAVAERIAAGVVAVPGSVHPVQVIRLDRPDDRPPWALAAAGVRRALAEHDGDVLAFLPGAGEIARTGELLGDLVRSGVEILPLHGSLALDEQERALLPGPGRRVVLATNVAETSLTVPGARVVVDTGLAKTLRYDPGVGLDRLELGRISRASADQRTGRAGREAPGACLRLWTAAEDRGLVAFETPEIARVDLSGALLQLLAWGEADATSLPWLDPPEPGRLGEAERLLRLLGAVDRTGVTALGRAMAALPLPPRVARLALAGAATGHLREAARAAAILAEGDPLPRREGPAPPVDSDLAPRLEALARGGGGAARRALRVAEQVERSVHETAPPVAQELAVDEALGRALLAAYPDRLSRRREPGGDRALMVGGRGVRLSPGSGVRRPELFLALDLDAGRRGERAEAWVRLAAGVDRSWLDPEAITETVDVELDERGRAVARRRKRFEDLVLEEAPAPLPAAAAEEAVVAAAGADPARALGLDRPEVASFLARVAFLRQAMPELAIPDLDEATLRDLLPALAAGRRSLGELREAPVVPVLQGILGAAGSAAVEREAPERIEVPSGSRVRLDYGSGPRPVLAVKIQELFGLAETPRLAGGRIPVLLHLLAPNGRPQQVTDDLAGFWRRIYPEVRGELRGRYPKHAWPEDPLAAAPERRPQRRRPG